jgi:hypothetical protein
MRLRPLLPAALLFLWSLPAAGWAKDITGTVPASTASALDHTPSQCSGQTARGIAANGNAQCSALAASELPAATTSAQGAVVLAPDAGTTAGQAVQASDTRLPINAQTFGAVGNGVADDTAALQAAIDAVGAVKGVLVIPPGLYRVTDTLKVLGLTGFTIEGPGSGFTTAHGFGLNALQWDGPSDRPMFSIENSQRVVFRDLQIIAKAGKTLYAAFLSRTTSRPVGAYGASENTWKEVSIFGSASAPVLFGFRFTLETFDGFTGGDGNNDLSTFDHVRVQGGSAMTAAWELQGLQTVGHHFYGCDCRQAKYCVDETEDQTLPTTGGHGAFSWYGGFSTTMSVADFMLGYNVEPTLISGHHSEHSARLLKTWGGFTYATPITLENVFFASDDTQIAADKKAVIFDQPGPLKVYGGSFNAGAALSPVKIELISTGTTPVAAVIENTFFGGSNAIAADPVVKTGTGPFRVTRSGNAYAADGAGLNVTGVPAFEGSHTVGGPLFFDEDGGASAIGGVNVHRPDTVAIKSQLRIGALVGFNTSSYIELGNAAVNDKVNLWRSFTSKSGFGVLAFGEPIYYTPAGLALYFGHMSTADGTTLTKQFAMDASGNFIRVNAAATIGVDANPWELRKPIIASFANAAHDHSNAAGGGNLPEASVTNLVSDLTAKAPTARLLTVTSPLTGGGDLSADRTFGCQTASGSQAGCLSAADWAAFNAKGPGTVTSVGLSVPGLLYSVSGSPVTGSGTLAFSLVTQAANKVLAGPVSGADAVPTIRLLDPLDIPSLDTAKITSGTLATARMPALTGPVTTSAGAVATTSRWTYSSGPGTGVSASATVYFPASGLATASATESYFMDVLDFTGTVDHLYCKSTFSSPGGSASYTMTLRKNGGDQTVTCSMTGAATSCEDSAHSFSVVKGDAIDIKLVPASTPTVIVLTCATGGTRTT